MAYKYDKDTSAATVVQDHMSEIAGKVILTTGVTPGGLGAEYVEQIAVAKPQLLILAGRSSSKLQQTADKLKSSGVATRLLELDLTSFSSIKTAAATVNGWDDVPAIHVLVNNAGIMAVDYSKTVDGHESQFQANHLGPFLFTNLIMPKLLASRSPRVVMVSSDGHRLGPVRFDDYHFHDGESYGRWESYGQSKTANMLMAISLAQKLGNEGLQAYSLHPGVIMTNLSAHSPDQKIFESLGKLDKQLGNIEAWRGLQLKSMECGVATHVYASFATDLADKNGAYLQDAHLADPLVETLKVWGTSPYEAERLWKLSEKLVGSEFSY